MTTKIGLAENMKRLKGAGVMHETTRSFDEGYKAGFDNGVKYLREQLALEIESLKCNYEFPEEECSIENAAIQQCADVVRRING
jgi:hypothetical protein